MLDPADVLVLPHDVRHLPGRLVDDVRRVAHPLNSTAGEVLACPGESLGCAAERIARRWGLAPEQARADVLRFAWHLNAAALANVQRGTGRGSRTLAWIVLTLRLLPAGRLPQASVRRIALDTRSPSRAIGSAVISLGPRAVRAATVAAAVLALAGAAAGSVSPWAVVALAGSLGASLVVHETAHVVALAGEPAALVLAGPRTSLLHGDLGDRRRAVVAAVGPLATGAVGVVATAGALELSSALAALVACPPAGHALAATVASIDGRTACGLTATERRR